MRDRISPPEDLLTEARQALRFAYAPYSHFSVGACIRAANGQLFSGCNLENASYGLTLCAEASALAALVRGGQQCWSEILIISSGEKLCSPCGACRQRLFEFAKADSICHLTNFKAEYARVGMSELFPLPFGAFNLESP
jgi:cytidine deaminase